jgi:methylmalonyl-CoA mutase N-terminal domain/subunit
VGINCHVTEASAAIPVFKADPAGEQAQVERLRRLRADRDAEAVEAALAAVGATAGSGGNLMPAILDAVRCYATVGEICGVLRERFGTYAGRAPG